MDSTLIILVFGAFLIFAAIVGYFSYKAQQRRLAELLTLAEELNWRFVGDEDYSYDERFPQFSMFRQGDERYAYNTLSGPIHVGADAWRARMGDYHYQTTSSDGKTTTTHDHHFSYVLIDLPYASLPDLRIRREGIFDHVASAFGFGDINFESAEFSKRFHVKSSDKRFAYDVIYPAMMEFLLAEEPPTIEISGGQCCLADGSSTWSAAEFRDRVNWATKFFELWPKHLVAALKSG